MRHLGQVIVCQVNGNWQDKLRKLKGEFQLSRKTLKQVRDYVAKRPLHKQCEVHPDWREYGPEGLDGGFTLFYTNHHFFPTVWLIKSEPGDALPRSMVDGEDLSQFYIEGDKRYDFTEPNGNSLFVPNSKECALLYGLLPADLKVIYRSAMPDNLLRGIYNY